MLNTLARAEQLLNLLTLEQIEENLFRGQNEDRGPLRLFGGQVLAQATSAASATVADLHVHALHAYFLTPGNPQRPVVYEVERIRDGRSFTTRRVVAIQDGQAIFSMDVSFQLDEIGVDHAHPMPNVPPPHELQDDLEVVANVGDSVRLPTNAARPRPFELRSVFPIGSDAWAQNRHHNPVWLRFPQQIEDQVLARSLLAYASDMGLVDTARYPHASDVASDDVQKASLDHALWIHRNVPMGEWLLLNKRTTNAFGGRGMVHADFFSKAGELLASVTQEGLLRLQR